MNFVEIAIANLSSAPAGLAGELGRDTKSVHREVAMLTATGLIERRAVDEVAVGWDRAVTELDLAAQALASTRPPGT